MLFGKEGWRNILISTLVISGAFTVQNISPGFFILCFSIVFLSFVAHHIGHHQALKLEGIETKTSLSGIGIIVTLVSGILSQGMVVVAVPLLTRMKATGTARWDKERETGTGRDFGIVSLTGPLMNLILGTVFLGLYSFTGIWTLWLVSLVNFWLGISNLIPYPPIDGKYVLGYGEILWFVAFLVALSGLVGLLVVL